MIRAITPGDSEYPKRLREIYDPPAALYANGALAPEDEIAVALVGSRRATPYGLQMCEQLARGLAARGVTVVSGMARGIDTAAHRGALASRGRTVAVMGSGHGHVYPPENKELYAAIAAQGAVVTEYPDDVPPLPMNFPRRNRIISGMSLGVVVVEAARNSGALITARLALEQGREVFAVPGKISSPTSGGTNELIRDGAALVQGVEDIIEGLSLVPRGSAPSGGARTYGERIARMTEAYVYNSLNDDERGVYKVLSDEPLAIDEVVEAAGLVPAKASKALLSLELKKLIKALPGKYFIRTAGTERGAYE